MPPVPPLTTPTIVAAALVEKFGSAITASLPGDKHPRVHVDAPNWRAVAEFLRRSPAMDFDWLACISAVDYVTLEKLCCVYELHSTTTRASFAVKVFCPRSSPSIPSVMDLWPGANWHEREAFDLMGIDFPGHTDLRRILLPEDWLGHPLRKDYIFPREYHGIPGSYELDWKQQPE